MTTEPPDTHPSQPAPVPLALKSNEGLGQHVAWCRYVTKHERPTRIVLCDSDAQGAFPVFRLGDAFNVARLCAESHAGRADDCGDLARKLLAALSA